VFWWYVKKVAAKKAAEVQIKLGCFMTRFPTQCLESKVKNVLVEEDQLIIQKFYVCGGENLVIGKSPKLHFVNNITKPHNEYAVNNKAWET
jgi:hypothetical protein